MKPFIDFKTYNSTNPMGQYNPEFYPKTKHHLGSDFKVPLGTPIKAPCDGVMVKAVFNSARGNTGIFVFTYEGTEWGLELCHLKQLPSLGIRKQGEDIASTGNTGSATTGAHLHVTLHKDAMVTKNYTLLTSEAAFIKLWVEGKIVDPFLWFSQRFT